MKLLNINLPLLSQRAHYIAELGFVHILISLSLYYFSQYFFMIFLQIVFVICIFAYKKSIMNKIIFFSYLMCLNYALTLIFSFTAYILYFINLSAIIFFIYHQKITFSKKEFLACGVFASFAAGLLRYFEEEIFDLYIYLDVVDRQNYFSMEIAVLLSIMHLFILFFFVFKKDRKYLRYNREND